MCTFAKNAELIRIAQQNDWVVLVLLGCIFLYIFMLISLRRDSSVQEFLLQSFADSTNNFLSWIVIGLVHCLSLATLISQYVPLVPQQLSALQLFGFELNKFGFTFFTLVLFYLAKDMLGYVYFAGTGTLKKWEFFYFLASRFYFVLSLAVMALCFVLYFLPVDRQLFFTYASTGFFVAFILKTAVYAFHPGGALPEKWYYKILYICTLQIVPVMVLWKVLFL